MLAGRMLLDEAPEPQLCIIPATKRSVFTVVVALSLFPATDKPDKEPCLRFSYRPLVYLCHLPATRTNDPIGSPGQYFVAGLSQRIVAT